ncbi:MAG: hypothetical protein P4L93_08975 [Coriobacteriia bacterium]|nr:hypothetical protein [Coriobacteriia bacterium]
MTTPSLDEVTSQRNRTMLIAGVLAIVVVLIGAGVALAILAHRPAPVRPHMTPAQETSASPQPSLLTSSSLGATSSVVSTSTSSTTTATSTATTSTAGRVVRSGQIAYRLGGQIWVSAEDGTGAKAVYASAAGAYALSPDGKTLVVAPSSSTCVLVDTTSLTQVPISGPIDLPVWSPDSSWLAYTARTSTGGYEVRRINRDGSGDARVLSGAARPQIAPDGQRIAVNQSIDPTSTDILRVFDNGYNGSKVVRPVANGAGAQTFAWAASDVLYFTKDRIGTADGWLGVTDKGITKSSVIATLPVADPPVSPGDLYPSPDGSKVLLSMTGDDGHSRLYIADASAKKITPLSSLYDEYPVGWLLDGTAVLFIRGNAIQGETTALYRMRPDNTGRVQLVPKAGL